MMPRKIDYSGQSFGRLIVRSEHGRDRFGAVMWLCACACGATTVVRGGFLKDGRVRSCGCGVGDAARARKTHGATKTKLYRRWRAMINRCTLKSYSDYHNYGGRGISVCDRWRAFSAFADDMGATFSTNLELDRIDPNGDYNPTNCRWATRVEQQRNKLNNHRITFGGVTLTAVEWAELLGHKPNTLIYRIRRGWSVHRALTFGADVSRLEIANRPTCEAVDG